MKTKKIPFLIRSFETILDILISVLDNLVYFGFAPLLILLKKEPFFGTLDIAPTILPLIKKRKLFVYNYALADKTKKTFFWISKNKSGSVENSLNYRPNTKKIFINQKTLTLHLKVMIKVTE